MISQIRKVSQDERRIISEFGNGNTWKVCKYLEILSDSIVGDHYHNNKDEIFFLSKGRAKIILNDFEANVQAPIVIDVKRGTYHAFEITKGSILIGLATEEHDPNDDHKKD